MSRLIIKNLPKNITENKLRELFEEKGTITDIQLKYTKDGVFRQFAFIGYQNENNANEAVKYFNNSFIQTTRIKVEVCEALGSESKPKSWSKHATDSNAYRKINGIEEQERIEKKQKDREDREKSKKNKKVDEILEEYKNDPEFQEFMKVHDKNRTLWANDCDVLNESKEKDVDDKVISKENEEQSKLDKGTDNDSVNSDENNDQNDSNDSKESLEGKLALKSDISDLEYMNSLIKGNDKKISDNSEKKKTKTSVDLYTIKIFNLPFKTKKQDILKFFKPLKPKSVRIPQNSKGFCYVGFKQEMDFKKAMLKDKSFIKGKQIYFSNFTEKNKISISKKDNESSEVYDKTGKWSMQKEGIENEEDISESGKIFFRNLSYTVTDDDIQKLFETFGPIAEISLPVDSITRKIKGFGTVTFVMPENAVKAFNDLDGTTFHGRLLHLIPGKSKDHEEPNMEGLSFKAQKALKLKKSAGETHNWNSLFIGANAVADNLAKTFETTKETILDANRGGSSAAVRLALGETQIVMEIKKFLEDNDVQLNVFETVPKNRSKTVILVKNLPAETTVEELTEKFSEFGILGRALLPPSGITAIIEFIDPSEAKKAFYKLAYSKFKYLPLYLEWAPENIFKNSTNINDDQGIKECNSKTGKNLKNEFDKSKSLREKIKEKVAAKEEVKIPTDEEESKEIVEADDCDDELPEIGTTLFLRNLNFNTRENTVKDHFKHLGAIHLAQVAMRRDAKNPNNVTSLGYGFIQFKKKATAERALKEMQFTNIDGNAVELKRSDRTLKMDPKALKKKANITAQTGTKILVRNIPFQANYKEIFEIFKAFGELRSVRLPKKLTPGESSLRGFGFVDYLSKSDAKKAFEGLSGSTHLYGRRLVLEWAKNDESDNIEELRKRTADTFNDTANKRSKTSQKAIFDTTISESDPNIEKDEMS